MSSELEQGLALRLLRMAVDRRIGYERGLGKLAECKDGRLFHPSIRDLLVTKS